MNTSVWWCLCEGRTRDLAHPVQMLFQGAAPCPLTVELWCGVLCLYLLLVSVSPFHVTFFTFDQTLFTFNEGLGAGRTRVIWLQLPYVSWGCFLRKSLLVICSGLFSWAAQISRRRYLQSPPKKRMYKHYFPCCGRTFTFWEFSMLLAWDACTYAL